ncbi:CO6A4-like protein [Mya arenaria]|uniref:CO6A4-like protein n=1 Tax=Mya arenaria TaxID=6604 RepID=A0ABY7DZT0_MYAAR|nr:CO6A4-like protein [Mya arenaria]
MYWNVPFVLILSSLLGMCRSANIDECAMNTPCKNAATCHNIIADFRCECVPGNNDKSCSTVCNSDKKADIVFLIDGSGSMTLIGFEETKSHIEKFISLFDIGPSKTQVGVIVFGSSAVIQFNLNKYNSADGVKHGLQDIEYPNDNTDVTAEALRLAKSSMFTPGGGSRTGAENVVILLTDGYSRTSDDNLVAAGELKAAGITIYTAGLDGPNREEMESIASGKEYYFSVKDNDGLDNLRDLLAVTTCTICNSDKKADIVFLIDGSGSMTLKGFEETKSFIEKFISLFNIGPSKTQVGVMVFGSSAVIQFNLNKYNSADGVKNGLRDIEYVYL